MTSSDLFKVMIIRRQITWKWYNIQLYYNGRPTESVCDLLHGAIFNDLERPLTPSFKVMPFFDAEYLRNGTTYRHSVIEILTGTYTCSTQQCQFEWPRVTLLNIQWHEALCGLSATAKLLVTLCSCQLNIIVQIRCGLRPDIWSAKCLSSLEKLMTERIIFYASLLLSFTYGVRH